MAEESVFSTEPVADGGAFQRDRISATTSVTSDPDNFSPTEDVSEGGAFDPSDLPAGDNGIDSDDGVVRSTDEFPTGSQFVTGQNAVQFTVGPRGPRGEQGEQGDEGPQGPQGIQGPQGTMGTEGNGIASVTYSPPLPQAGDNITITITLDSGATTVFTIPAGTMGATGAQGPMGLPGTNGTDGVDGNTGPQGPMGTAGTDGDGIASITSSPSNPQSGDDITITVTLDSGTVTTFTIPAGATGSQGPQGPAGMDGATGPQGHTGAAGMDGAAGADGLNIDDLSSSTDSNSNTIVTLQLEDGTDLPSFTVNRGPQGLTGPTGPAGQAGQNGMDGQTGATGATGADGAQGTSVDDLTSTMDASGNTVVTLELDDGTDLPSFTVNKGDTGAEGPGGPQGASIDDLSSTMDSNGNTVVTLELDNGHDLPSFTVDRGPTGATGPQGPAGADGVGSDITILDEGTEITGVTGSTINFIGDDVHAVANTDDPNNTRYDIFIPTPAGAAKSTSSLSNYRAFRSTEHTNNITITASSGTTFTNDSSNPITVTPTGATIGTIAYHDDLITIPVIVAAGSTPGTNTVSVVIGDIDYDNALGSGTFSDQTVRSSIIDERSSSIPSLTTTPTSRSILSTTDQTYTVTRANDATVNSGTGWDVNDDYTVTGATVSSGGSPFSSGATTDTFTVDASEYTSNINITVNFDLASSPRNGQTGDPGNRNSTVSVYTPYVLLTSDSTPTSFPTSGHSTQSWADGRTLSWSGTGSNAYILIIDSVTNATVNDGQTNIDPIDRGDLTTTDAAGNTLTYTIWDYGNTPSVSYTSGDL